MDSGHFSTGSNSNSNSSSPQPESFQTLSHADNLDTSQDSVYPEEEEEEDNVSTVSEISGLSDLSGQEWKPMAGSIMRVSNTFIYNGNSDLVTSSLVLEIPKNSKPTNNRFPNQLLCIGSLHQFFTSFLVTFNYLVRF